MNLACDCVSKFQALIEFVEKGYSPNGVNSVGDCPIHCYITHQYKKKYVEFLYTLLSNSDVNVEIPSSGGVPPLHMAIKVRQFIH